ncbi:MAG: helix-turn-helix domain-containing protein [Alcanivoracaceae bacterium]|nr:helix-turn-helix domain-containing protein [Alcanivoracaceae bacterium]
MWRHVGLTERRISGREEKDNQRVPASMTIQGTAFLWPSYWLLLSNGIHNRPHRHVAASVLIGLDGPINIQIEGEWHLLDGAIVAPEIEQALDSQGQRTLIIHLDPDEPLWQHFKCALNTAGHAPLSITAENIADLEQCAEQQNIHQAEEWLEQLAQTVSHNKDDKASLDPRITAVTQYLRTHLPERLELATLADMANLSGSRLTHLFKQQTGVTLRRFLAHLKIQQALYRWQPGMQYAELAALAGFYDQPHLVRTAREMFDAMPSVIGNPGALTVVRSDALNPDP